MARVAARAIVFLIVSDQGRDAVVRKNRGCASSPGRICMRPLLKFAGVMLFSLEVEEREPELG